MKRNEQKFYICLTLYKQDIQEMVQIFHDQLQNVEITIDNVPIIGIQSMEYFDETYRAKSLVAHGYDGSGGAASQCKVSLRMDEAARLSGWDEVHEKQSRVVAQIERVLLRCQNRVYQYLVGSSFISTCFTPIPLVLLLQRYDHITQLLLLVGGTLLLVPVVFFLLARTVHLLKMDAYVFMLPGAMKTSKHYGRREAIGTFVVAFILFLVFDGILPAVFRMLWK